MTKVGLCDFRAQEKVSPLPKGNPPHYWLAGGGDGFGDPVFLRREEWLTRSDQSLSPNNTYCSELETDEGGRTQREATGG